MASHKITISRFWGETDLKPPPKPCHQWSLLFGEKLWRISDCIKTRGFSRPKTYQAQAIPIMLAGDDVIGIGEPGNGKTMAAIYAALFFMFTKQRKNLPTILILVAEKNSGLQIQAEMERHKIEEVNVKCLFDSSEDEDEATSDILITMPDQLKLLVDKKRIDLKNFSVVILEEVDTLNEMGMEKELNFILMKLHSGVKTIINAPHLSPAIKRLAVIAMKSPFLVSIKETMDDERENDFTTEKPSKLPRIDVENQIQKPQTTKIPSFEQTNKFSMTDIQYTNNTGGSSSASLMNDPKVQKTFNINSRVASTRKGKGKKLIDREPKMTATVKRTKKKVLFCICRSSDTTGFMIMCDICLEWYHGICINMTEEQSKLIKNYVCDVCKKTGCPSSSKQSINEEVYGNNSSVQDISGYEVVEQQEIDLINGTIISERIIHDDDDDDDADNEKFHEDLRNVANTTIASTILAKHNQKFVHLGLEAIFGKEGNAAIPFIQYFRRIGGLLEDSFLVEGFLIDVNDESNPIDLLENNNILFANCTFPGSFEDNEELGDEEQKEVEEIVQKILLLNCSVFINIEDVPGFLRTQLKNAGIVTIIHKNYEETNRLANLSGGEIVLEFDNAHLVKLGHCEVIEQITVNGEACLKLNGLELGESCTIVICGESYDIINEATQAFYSLLLELEVTLTNLRSYNDDNAIEGLQDANESSKDLSATTTFNFHQMSNKNVFFPYMEYYDFLKFICDLIKEIDFSRSPIGNPTLIIVDTNKSMAKTTTSFLIDSFEQRQPDLVFEMILSSNAKIFKTTGDIVVTSVDCNMHSFLEHTLGKKFLVFNFGSSHAKINPQHEEVDNLLTKFLGDESQVFVFGELDQKYVEIFYELEKDKLFFFKKKRNKVVPIPVELSSKIRLYQSYQLKINSKIYDFLLIEICAKSNTLILFNENLNYNIAISFSQEDILLKEKTNDFVIEELKLPSVLEVAKINNIHNVKDIFMLLNDFVNYSNFTSFNIFLEKIQKLNKIALLANPTIIRTVLEFQSIPNEINQKIYEAVEFFKNILNYKSPDVNFTTFFENQVRLFGQQTNDLVYKEKIALIEEDEF